MRKLVLILFAGMLAATLSSAQSRGGSRGGGGGSHGGFGGGSRGGGGYGGQREMFSTICSQCGKEAQVPFQPRGDKPVYCSDCFRSQRSSSGGYGRRY